MAGTVAVLLVAGTMSARAADQTWIDGNANNDWSTTEANWDAGVPWTNGNNAVFGGTGETVDVNGTVSVVNITFDVTGYDVGDAAGDGTLTLSGAPSVISVATAATNIISEVLEGTGGLTRNGDGVLELTGAASPSTGNTIINAGMIRWGATDALPAGTVTVADGATLEWTTTVNDNANKRSYTIRGTGVGGIGAVNNSSSGKGGPRTMDPLYLADDATVACSHRTDPYNVRLQGNRMTKIGVGSWNMRGSLQSGAGGAITVDAGLVQIEICNGSVQAVDGGIVVNANAYFALLSYLGPARSSNLDADITLNSGGLVGTHHPALSGIPECSYYGTVTVDGDCDLQMGWTGAAAARLVGETSRNCDIHMHSIIGGSGNLDVNPTGMGVAPGERTVTFYATNTLTGNILFDQGTNILATSGAFTNCGRVSVSSAATLVISNAANALGDTAQFIIANDSNSVSGVTLDSGVDDTIGGLVLGGVVQTAPGTYGSASSGADVQNDEYFSGPGVVRLVAVPDRTWIEANTNNDWSLTAANWDAGVPWAQNANAIFGGTGEAVELEDGISVGNVRFNVGGYSIDDADADGALTLSGAPSVITVANAGETGTVTKAIQGNGGLTKAGNGTLVLSGANSTSTGNTIINAGKVQWGATDALPSGPVTVNDGGTLEWTTTARTAANKRPLTITGAGVGGKGAILNNANNHGGDLLDGLTLAGNAAVGNGRRTDVWNVDSAGFTLTKIGVGNFNIRSLVGGTLQKLVVDEGLAQFEGVNAVVPDGITVNPGAYMSVLANNTDRTLTGDIVLDGGGLVATWWFPSARNTTVRFLSPITVSGDCTIQIGINSSVIVDETSNPTHANVEGSISGNGNLTLNPGGGLSNPGAKRLRLLCDNTGLTGTLTIGSGNVDVDDAGGTTGTLNNGSLVVNGTLWLNRADAQTIDGAVSGTGRLVIRYDGAVTFDGNSVGGGNLDVANGSLTLANGASVTLAGDLTVATRERQTNDLTIAADFSLPPGCSLTANAIIAGNDPGNLATSVRGTINQSGGTVATTGTTAEGNGLRLGHYPRADNVYNMRGGTLTIGGGYDLGIATDGAGWFNQTGGDVYTTRVMLNERNNAGGNGKLTVEGGTLHVGSGGITVDPPGPYTVALGGAGGTIKATADMEQTVNAALNGSGTNAVTFDSDGHTMTVSGALQGTGDLVKGGTGTVDITAACTYSGSTDVNAGTLRLSGSGSLAGSPDVEVAAGATLDIRNAGGALSDIVTLTIANDGDNGTGVTLDTGVDETVYALVLGGVAQTATGTYGSTSSGADVQDDGYFSGEGVVRLPAGAHWDGTDASPDADGGNGNWDLVTTNWDDVATGGSNVLWQNFPPARAVFGGAAGTVELDAAVTVAGLLFTTDGYVLADGDTNGTLTLSGTPVLSVDTGLNATVSEELTGTGGFLKTGAGRLTLATNNLGTLTGSVIVNEGTLRWGANNALPDTTAATPITVNDGATVDFGALGNVNNSRHYTLAGNGVGGIGAMVKTGGGAIAAGNAVDSVKLVAETSIGGTSRFDLRGVDQNGFKLTKVGFNGIAMRINPIVNTSGGFAVDQGTVYFENFNQVMSGPVTVADTMYLGMYPYSGNSQSFTADITKNGGRLIIGSNEAG